MSYTKFIELNQAYSYTSIIAVKLYILSGITVQKSHHASSCADLLRSAKPAAINAFFLKMCCAITEAPGALRLERVPEDITGGSERSTFKSVFSGTCTLLCASQSGSKKGEVSSLRVMLPAQGSVFV